MEDYPEAVAKIVDDYLQRLRKHARLAPAEEQAELLTAVQSKISTAYQSAAGDDPVSKILTVLSNLGEPIEVVAARFPKAMIHSGLKHKWPLYLLGGVLIALFGLPLGFGGAGVLIGIFCALAGIVVAFYATAGSFLFTGSLLSILGFVRMAEPAFWNRLVALGYIQMDFHWLNWRLGDLWEAMTPEGQGFLILFIAAAFLAAGLGMLWVGRRSLHGLRFLSSLGVDFVRRITLRMKAKLATARAVRQSSAFAGQFV